MVSIMFKKIAYINIARVLNESQVGLLERERLNEVKNILMEAEKAAMQIYETMSEQDKQRNSAVDMANINQSWQIEQQNARSISVGAIINEVDSYRISKELDMILNQDFVLSAESKYDVTSDFIEVLKDISIDYGNLPNFSVNVKSTEGKECETVSPPELCE